MTDKQVIDKKLALHNQLIAIIADYKDIDNVAMCDDLAGMLTAHELILIEQKQRRSHISIHNALSNDLE